MALVVLALALPATAERRNLARGLSVEGDALRIEDAAGAVAVDVRGWTVLPPETPGVVALVRRVGGTQRVRVVDRRGRTLGEIAVPFGWVSIVTDGGIVLVPDALHAPFRAHVLRFLSHTGEPRRTVEEPGLELVRWSVGPGGRLATVSTGRDDAKWTAIAYDADGAELMRHVVEPGPSPEAIFAAEGHRLVVLAASADVRTTTLTVVAPGRRPRKGVRLPNVTNLVADSHGSRVAAVGQEVVALLDGRTGKLLWRRDRRIEHVVPGGLRFDRHAPRLIVVGAEPDVQARKVRLGFHTFRLGNGAEAHAVLGAVPVHAVPSVVDVEREPAGRRRVVFHDRAMTAERPEPVP
jgi:hypothetical protein